MRGIFLVVLLVMNLMGGSFAKVEASENFSVSSGNIAIITVGDMQVAVHNNDHADCGTFYIIDPATKEILGMGGILEFSNLFINGDEISMHCVFSAVGDKKNTELESRPLVVRN